MNSSTRTVEISPSACERIEAMSAHVEEIGRYFGEDSHTYRTTAASYMHAIGRVFSLLAEGGSLSADGARGLYVITGYGMHVGCVFFVDHEYRTAMTDQTSARVCLSHKRPIIGDEPYACDAHGTDNQGCMARVCAVPGTWSLHS